MIVYEDKKVATKEFLWVRPIFALQVFEDDPVAHMLITAQMHCTVDVLRARVRGKKFNPPITPPNDRSPSP